MEALSTSPYFPQPPKPPHAQEKKFIKLAQLPEEKLLEIIRTNKKKITNRTQTVLTSLPPFIHYVKQKSTASTLLKVIQTIIGMFKEMSILSFSFLFAKNHLNQSVHDILKIQTNINSSIETLKALEELTKLYNLFQHSLQTVVTRALSYPDFLPDQSFETLKMKQLLILLKESPDTLKLIPSYLFFKRFDAYEVKKYVGIVAKSGDTIMHIAARLYIRTQRKNYLHTLFNLENWTRYLWNQIPYNSPLKETMHDFLHAKNSDNQNFFELLQDPYLNYRPFALPSLLLSEEFFQSPSFFLSFPTFFEWRAPSSYTCLDIECLNGDSIFHIVFRCTMKNPEKWKNKAKILIVHLLNFKDHQIRGYLLAKNDLGERPDQFLRQIDPKVIQSKNILTVLNVIEKKSKRKKKDKMVS